MVPASIRLWHGPPVALFACLLLVLVSTEARGYSQNRLARSLLQEDTVEPGKGTSFPYRTCASSDNPWRARLAYQEDVSGETLVHLHLWAEKSDSQLSLWKLMIDLGSNDVKDYYADTFVDVRLWDAVGGTRNVTAPVIWNENRPVVRFTGLRLDYSVGRSENGYRLMFKSLAGSMTDICPGNCTYATVTDEAICTMGTLGRTPIIVVETPDWVVNGPYDDATYKVTAPAPGAGGQGGTADAEEETDPDPAPIQDFNPIAHIISGIKARVYQMLVEEKAPVADVIETVSAMLKEARDSGFDLSLEDIKGVVGEVYYVAQLAAALTYPPTREWRKERHHEMCKDVHDEGCRTCTTCHFCRQKHTEVMTHCKQCGTTHGTWCSKCLWLRMGENFDEVMAREDGWICPCCRTICNCSGGSCQRASNGWAATTRLNSEANNQMPSRHKSVALYLVTAQLSADETISDADLRPWSEYSRGELERAWSRFVGPLASRARTRERPAYAELGATGVTGAAGAGGSFGRVVSCKDKFKRMAAQQNQQVMDVFREPPPEAMAALEALVGASAGLLGGDGDGSGGDGARGGGGGGARAGQRRGGGELGGARKRRGAAAGLDGGGGGGGDHGDAMEEGEDDHAYGGGGGDGGACGRPWRGAGATEASPDGGGGGGAQQQQQQQRAWLPGAPGVGAPPPAFGQGGQAQQVQRAQQAPGPVFGLGALLGLPAPAFDLRAGGGDGGGGGGTAAGGGGVGNAAGGGGVGNAAAVAGAAPAAADAAATHAGFEEVDSGGGAAAAAGAAAAGGRAPHTQQWERAGAHGGVGPSAGGAAWATGHRGAGGGGGGGGAAHRQRAGPHAPYERRRANGGGGGGGAFDAGGDGGGDRYEARPADGHGGGGGGGGGNGGDWDGMCDGGGGGGYSSGGGGGGGGDMSGLDEAAGDDGDDGARGALPPLPHVTSPDLGRGGGPGAHATPHTIARAGAAGGPVAGGTALRTNGDLVEPGQLWYDPCPGPFGEVLKSVRTQLALADRMLVKPWLGTTQVATWQAGRIAALRDALTLASAPSQRGQTFAASQIDYSLGMAPAATGGSARGVLPLPLWHSQLQHAGELLVLLAAELPEGDVGGKLMDLVCKPPGVVNFKRCDALGRGILCGAALRVLGVLRTRLIATHALVKYLVTEMLDVLVDEHAELSLLISKGLELEICQEMRIGPLHLPPAVTSKSCANVLGHEAPIDAVERMDVVKHLKQEDERAIATLCKWLAMLKGPERLGLLDHGVAGMLGKRAVQTGAAEIAGLPKGLRTLALGLVVGALEATQSAICDHLAAAASAAAPTAAYATTGAAAAATAVTAAAAAAASHAAAANLASSAWDKLHESLEDLVCEMYPCRRNKALGLVMLTPPTPHAAGSPEAAFYELAVTSLCKVHACMVATGKASWGDAAAAAYKPYAAIKLWVDASADHRQLATFMVAKVLECVTHCRPRDQLPPAAPLFLLAHWTRVCLEAGGGGGLVSLTVQMASCPTLRPLFQGALPGGRFPAQSLDAMLCADDAGTARGALLQSVLGKLGSGALMAHGGGPRGNQGQGQGHVAAGCGGGGRGPPGGRAVAGGRGAHAGGAAAAGASDLLSVVDERAGQFGHRPPGSPGPLSKLSLVFDARCKEAVVPGPLSQVVKRRTAAVVQLLAIVTAAVSSRPQHSPPPLPAAYSKLLEKSGETLAGVVHLVYRAQPNGGLEGAAGTFTVREEDVSLDVDVPWAAVLSNTWVPAASNSPLCALPLPPLPLMTEWLRLMAMVTPEGVCNSWASERVPPEPACALSALASLAAQVPDGSSAKRAKDEDLWRALAVYVANDLGPGVAGMGQGAASLYRAERHLLTLMLDLFARHLFRAPLRGMPSVAYERLASNFGRWLRALFSEPPMQQEESLRSFIPRLVCPTLELLTRQPDGLVNPPPPPDEPVIPRVIGCVPVRVCLLRLWAVLLPALASSGMLPGPPTNLISRVDRIGRVAPASPHQLCALASSVLTAILSDVQWFAHDASVAAWQRQLRNLSSCKPIGTGTGTGTGSGRGGGAKAGSQVPRVKFGSKEAAATAAAAAAAAAAPPSAPQPLPQPAGSFAASVWARPSQQVQLPADSQMLTQPSQATPHCAQVRPSQAASQPQAQPAGAPARGAGAGGIAAAGRAQQQGGGAAAAPRTQSRQQQGQQQQGQQQQGQGQQRADGSRAVAGARPGSGL
ncbi:hypothetical protein FOA52_003264 [Chlamydomonas sp. UWO 241]|nr:hypothetical protein FOA52_003264 [Chlamydomonas sp. UWO 241]